MSHHHNSGSVRGRGSETLQALDINVQPFLEGKDFFLPLPPKPARSDEQTSRRTLCGAREFTAPLNYNELQKRLRDVLMRLDLFRDGDAEKRRQFLREEFLRLIHAACEETRQLLAPALNSCLLSFCVLEVLHLRRRTLCTGFELGLNDLKEWISLAMLLEEADVVKLIPDYAQKLGPCSRQSVEEAMALNRACTTSLCASLLELKIPGEHSVSFKSRYYSLMLDDLIAMGDESPQATLISSVQSEVTLQLRELHAEWLLQISVALNLQLETFFLAVTIVDRYLSKVPVQRERLHLVGCAGLLLASKQEEIYPVSLRALVRYGADRFTAEVLVSTECQILAVLGFDVVVPTLSLVGMGLLLQQDPAPSEAQRSYLMYLLASLAIRTHYRQYRLSALAATAVYMSRVCFRIATGPPCDEVAALLPFARAAVRRNSAAGAGGVYDIFGAAAYHEASRLQLPETA